MQFIDLQKASSEYQKLPLKPEYKPNFLPINSLQKNQENVKLYQRRSKKLLSKVVPNQEISHCNWVDFKPFA